MSLEEGYERPDWTAPHYRYLWRAQYDDLRKGSWIEQIDERGLSRSTRLLEWDRVVRIELRALEIGRPIIEMRTYGKVKGNKFWQCDLLLTGKGQQRVVREVLEMTGAEKVYVLYQWEDNRIIFSPQEDN